VTNSPYKGRCHRNDNETAHTRKSDTFYKGKQYCKYDLRPSGAKKAALPPSPPHWRAGARNSDVEQKCYEKINTIAKKS